MIRLASILGGTSIYWGILWGEPDRSIWFLGLRRDYPEHVHPRY